jgi:RNA polymerase sigma-70 factor, ECF subfamily
MVSPMDPSTLGGPPPESFTDTKIHFEAARGGEESAYQELLSRFRPGLETLLAMEINRTIGVALRNKMAAHGDDLLQETIVKGFRALHEIEYLGPGSVLAYFAQILRNEIHNFRAYWTADRRNPGRELTAPASSTFADAGPVEPGGGPSTVFRISEERQRVADALAKLADQHRELLVMRFFAGASWAEIASQLEIVSPDAARMECKKKALPAFALALSR